MGVESNSEGTNSYKDCQQIENATFPFNSVGWYLLLCLFRNYFKFLSEFIFYSCTQIVSVWNFFIKVTILNGGKEINLAIHELQNIQLLKGLWHLKEFTTLLSKMLIPQCHQKNVRDISRDLFSFQKKKNHIKKTAMLGTSPKREMQVHASLTPIWLALWLGIKTNKSGILLNQAKLASAV